MSREEQEEAQKELTRIFAYLEPHIAPKDVSMVRWAFGLSDSPSEIEYEPQEALFI